MFCYFSVADFGFGVELPDNMNTENVLRSFAPFRCDNAENPIFLLKVILSDQDISLSPTHSSNSLSSPSLSPSLSSSLLPDDVFIDETVSDLGHLRLYRAKEGYFIEILHDDGSPADTLRMNADYSRAVAFFPSGDTGSLSSMLRIIFSQAIASRDGFLIHASAVCAGGEAFLFLGKSGTGKSTHSRLWLETFPDSFLLNDDNPAVRLMSDGSIYAYGTPWSGKTPCYLNSRYPLHGILRLEQAPVNEYRALSDVEAFVALLPGLSVISDDKRLYNSICDTAATVAETVAVGHLRCLPDHNAARLAASKLSD